MYFKPQPQTWKWMNQQTLQREPARLFTTARRWSPGKRGNMVAPAEHLHPTRDDLKQAIGGCLSSVVAARAPSPSRPCTLCCAVPGILRPFVFSRHCKCDEDLVVHKLQGVAMRPASGFEPQRLQPPSTFFEKSSNTRPAFFVA